MIRTPAWRAVWLALGDPLRMGRYGVAAIAIMLFSVAMPWLDLPQVLVSQYRDLIDLVVWLARCLVVYSGILLVLGKLSTGPFLPFRLVSISITAIVFLLIQMLVDYAFPRVYAFLYELFLAWSIDLVFIAILCIGEICLLRAARTPEVVLPLHGIRMIVRRPAILVVYILASKGLYWVGTIWLSGAWVYTEQSNLYWFVWSAYAYLNIALSAFVARMCIDSEIDDSVLKAFD